MSEADDEVVVVRAHRQRSRVGLVAPTLLAIVLVAIAATLGWWQLEAWQERRAAEARDLTQLDPVPLVEVMGPDDPFDGDDIGRPVTFEGQWLPEGLFFVAGRELDDRDGFWPVVPLAVSESGESGEPGEPGESGGSGGSGAPAIPVVLGWTESVDEVMAPTGRGVVTGWLQPPDGNGAVDDDPDDDVVPQLRTADAIQRVENDLFSAYAISTEPTPGLSPASLDALPPVGRFTALRNLLYALEWWVFGAFAAFIWWRWVRDEQAAEPVTDSGT